MRSESTITAAMRLAWNAQTRQRAAVERARKGLSSVGGPAEMGGGPADLADLVTIERRLRKLAEDDCDYGLTDRAKLQRRRWEKRAAELAAKFGAEAYFQRDPRGCALYLIFPGDVPDGANVYSCYTNGLAVCL